MASKSKFMIFICGCLATVACQESAPPAPADAKAIEQAVSEANKIAAEAAKETGEANLTKPRVNSPDQ